MIAISSISRRAALLLCVVLTACGGKAHMAAPVPVAWRVVATGDDRDRLRRWRDAWTEALAKVHASGRDGDMTADTALFDPDRALTDSLPPPGHYTCRIFKLGGNGTAMHDVTLYPPADCRVSSDRGVTMFYRSAGVQRPVGTLYPDGPARTIFLGTLVFGDELKPLEYGQDTKRDLAGYIERIGERRWRLVLPYPHFESLLDVIELTPAS